MKGICHLLKVFGVRLSPVWVGAAILLVLSHVAVSQTLPHRDDVQVVNARLTRGGQPWIPHGFHQIAFAVAPGAFEAAPHVFKVAAEHFSTQEFAEMKEQGADSVRIQVAQNGMDTDGMHYSPEFRTRVVSAVRAARNAGLVVIISIQNEEQTGQPQEEVELPSDATKRVWDFLAPKFRDDRGVLYEVFNEPRIRPIPPQGPTAEQWRQWAAAMNWMIRVVRSYGAENVVVADGLQRAETLHGAPQLNDPLRQVVYASHPYAHTPQDQCPDAWRSKFGELSFQAPVIISEWGIGYYCDVHTPKATELFLQYLQERGIGLEIGTWDWASPTFGSYNYGFPNPQLSSFQGGFCSGRTISAGFGVGKMVERWYRTGSPSINPSAGDAEPRAYAAYCKFQR